MQNLEVKRTPAAEFLTVGGCAFLTPWLHSWGQYPAAELAMAGTWFACVAVLQALAIAGVIRTTGQRAGIAMLTGCLATNLFFFVFVLTPASAATFAGVTLLYCGLFVAAAMSQRARAHRFMAFIVAVHAAGGALAVLKPPATAQTVQPTTLPAPTKRAQRSVYVVGLDSLVSTKAYTKLFEATGSAAYDELKRDGFALRDFRSPGDQTLTTYAAFLQNAGGAHPRTARPLFSGLEPSALYTQLAALGFKRQFFYQDDYFGTDSGQIEAFFPDKRTFSLCSYIDPRWGFGICRWGGPAQGEEETSPLAMAGDHLRFFKKHVQLDQTSPWFSIHHIWFPGHTLLSHDGRKQSDRAAFRQHYIDAQSGIKEITQAIRNHIRTVDPGAVVVFIGDHGTLLFRGVPIDSTLDEYGERLSPELADLDARSVLLAVHPANFCAAELDRLQNWERLFSVLALCASG